MSFNDLDIEEKVVIVSELYNPLFPLWSKNVFLNTWVELRSKGAKIVFEKEIDEDSFFLEDEFYYNKIPVIEYQGKTYDRFLELVRDVYPNGEEMISNWKKELSESSKGCFFFEDV